MFYYLEDLFHVFSTSILENVIMKFIQSLWQVSRGETKIKAIAVPNDPPN